MVYGALIWMIIMFGVSCNNEIDITGEYKDTPIVYGILDPTDAVHYIRIQKAFLVDGNVLQTVKVGDSLTYDPSDLQVSIFPILKNGELNGSPIPFTHQPNATTDTGLFAPQGVMIYTSTAGLTSPYYKLVITNTKLGRQITSKTIMTNKVEWMKPSFGSVHLVGVEPYEMQWSLDTATATIYQPEMKFYWTEVDLVTGNTLLDSVVWDFIQLYPSAIDIKNNFMKLKLEFFAFYAYLKKKVPVKPHVKRIIGPLTFSIYTAPSDFDRYIQANKPVVGLIQDKPDFTNIEGGFGLFSSRNKSIKANVPLTPLSKDSLEFGQFTKHLGFKKN